MKFGRGRVMVWGYKSWTRSLSSSARAPCLCWCGTSFLSTFIQWKVSFKVQLLWFLFWKTPTCWSTEDKNVFLLSLCDSEELGQRSTSRTLWVSETRPVRRSAPLTFPRIWLDHFPPSSLKVLPTCGSREHLNIQFHSFLNLDHRDYLLLSQSLCWGEGARRRRPCFIVSKAGRRTTREQGVMSGEPVALP